MKKAKPGAFEASHDPAWQEISETSLVLYAGGDDKEVPIGQLHLQYEFNRNWRPENWDLFYQLLILVKRLEESLGETLQMDVDLIFRERRDKDIYNLFRFAQPTIGSAPDLQDGILPPLSQALLLETIEKRGPIALRSVEIGDTLTTWLEDREISGKRINAVAGALRQYAKSRKSLAPGTEPSEKLAIIGEREVVNLYRDLLQVTNLFRDGGRSVPENRRKKCFQQTIANYYRDLRERFIKSEDPSHSDSYRVLFATDMNSLPILCELITDVIFEDKSLGKEFLSLGWQPHAMAKKIIARLLGLGWSKIKKVVRPVAII